MTTRYFLDQDSSCHWYLVEAEHAEEWDEWCDIPEDDERAWTPPDFASPLGGSPRITFENPSEEPV